ncbi:hypothetical protein [Cryobacterium serini]|uniref:Uncharacterized protein n=1 Tax=Cryobacterium serini TaxID=1259201 RepID=A0A4R9BUL3_9MICO|nr:hypothetical protein [Cryobacterium serini]TFD91355.1 hypothetical protein E3T51_01185 [Cryobacterium serini]
MTHRDDSTSRWAWDVLVAGSVLFPFEFVVENDTVVNIEITGLKIFDSTNALLLVSSKFMIEACTATEVRFETAADVLTVERLTGEHLDPCSGGFDDLMGAQWGRRAGFSLLTANRRSGP